MRISSAALAVAVVVATYQWNRTVTSRRFNARSGAKPD
jgi:hypothetical protein